MARRYQPWLKSAICGSFIVLACATEFDDPETVGFDLVPNPSSSGAGGAANPPIGGGGSASTPIPSVGGSSANPPIGSGGTSSPPVTTGGMPSSVGGSTTIPPVNSGGQAAGGTAQQGGSGPSAGGTGPAGPPGEVLLFEDFESGLTTSWVADMGPDGADSVGMWAVANGTYQQQLLATDRSWTVGGDISWTDQSLEATVQYLDAADIEDALIYLAIRFQDRERFYFMEFRGDGVAKIRSRIDGSESELLSIELGAILALNTPYRIRFTAQGTTLSMFLDDFPIGTAVMDASLASGGIALGSVDATASFDDVTVTLP